MGCFSWPGDSSMTKIINNHNVPRTNMRNKYNRHVYRRGDKDRNAKGLEVKISPYRVAKDEEGSLYTSSSAASLAWKLSGERLLATSSDARIFTYDELEAATERFKEEYFLGEGGFGRVYKGHIRDTGQVVAIKKLDRNGCQGAREFIVEVLTLGVSDHPNLVKLIGYCAEGDERLLVYEYMPLGSLEDHLHDPGGRKKQLDWSTRMKIAAGAAQGLEYLHDKMKPQVIYRDLKCSNILLGKEYNPKLSDLGLAKLGPLGDKTHVSTRVMGTYGYCAPDYAMTGKLTSKSDIYSFGVVLLELLTGRRAIDMTKYGEEKSLVIWARPLFRDRNKFHQMADPALEGRYPSKALYQSLAIAAMCLQADPNPRPVIADVASALNYLATQKFDPTSPSYIKRVKQAQLTEHAEE